MNRVLGKVGGESFGPLIVIVGGLHGNELAGVKAIHSIFGNLSNQQIPVMGKIIGIAGNIKALAAKSRYIDYDLNRCWNDEFVAALRQNEAENSKAEDEEVLSLLDVIESESQGHYSHKFLVDLHTTSSENGNFIVIPQEAADHPVIKVLELPIIMDLNKYLNGTLLQFMHDRGFTSYAFEGGKIGSQEAINLHRFGLWKLLEAKGSIPYIHENELNAYENFRTKFVKNLPDKVMVLYRHWVDKNDAFKMKPGYQNFQKIKKGEILAIDRSGEIKAKCDGLIFMPLYQEFGNDGFFVVKELETA